MSEAQLHVEFFTQAEENQALSLKEGRPVFEDKEFVRIRFPGDNKREHVAPAHEGYRRDRENGNRWVTWAEDYPRHYDAFKQKASQAAIGTPLTELPFLTEARRAELRALNIHTAEMLAEMPETNYHRLGMNGRALAMQARAYLERAKDGALEAKMSAENAALKQQIDLLQQQMAGILSKPAPAPEIIEEEPTGSVFESWTDENLKAFIQAHAGSRPKGNPSHASLVKMAEEANERAAA